MADMVVDLARGLSRWSWRWLSRLSWRWWPTSWRRWPTRSPTWQMEFLYRAYSCHLLKVYPWLENWEKYFRTKLFSPWVYPNCISPQCCTFGTFACQQHVLFCMTRPFDIGNWWYFFTKLQQQRFPRRKSWFWSRRKVWCAVDHFCHILALSVCLSGRCHYLSRSTTEENKECLTLASSQVCCWHSQGFFLVVFAELLTPWLFFLWHQAVWSDFCING